MPNLCSSLLYKMGHYFLDIKYEFGLHAVASGHLCAQDDFEHIVNEYKKADLKLQMIMVILPFKVRETESKILTDEAPLLIPFHPPRSLINTYFSKSICFGFSLSSIC